MDILFLVDVMKTFFYSHKSVILIYLSCFINNFTSSLTFARLFINNIVIMRIKMQQPFKILAGRNQFYQQKDIT